MKPSAEPESPEPVPVFTGSVWTTFEVVGFHNWPEAPDEVDHLRSRHRHLFKVRLEVGVSHAERAVEFQLLRTNALGFLVNGMGVEDNVLGSVEFGHMSCESIAQGFIGFLMDFYPSSYPYEVSVSEDGENGATVRVELQ